MILTLFGISPKEGNVAPIIAGTLIAATTVITLVSSILVAVGWYSTVSERMQEIGILRFLGAPATYIFSLLLLETLLIAIPGATIGIALTYAGRWVMMFFLSDFVTQNIESKWWPIAGAISIGSALLGAMIPAWRAVKQEVIKVLSCEE